MSDLLFIFAALGVGLLSIAAALVVHALLLYFALKYL